MFDNITKYELSNNATVIIELQKMMLVLSISVLLSSTNT